MLRSILIILIGLFNFLRNYANKILFQNRTGYHTAFYFTILRTFFDAITAFELAIAISEDNSTAHLYKAQSLISLDNYKDGIESLHEAKKLDPDEPLVLFFLGQAYEKQGELDYGCNLL